MEIRSFTLWARGRKNASKHHFGFGDVRVNYEVAMGYCALDRTRYCRGRLSPRRVDKRTFARHLYLPDVPDVDLMIRTSGEQRLSNYMLWQMAYAEFMFSPAAPTLIARLCGTAFLNTLDVRGVLVVQGPSGWWCVGPLRPGRSGPRRWRGWRLVRRGLAAQRHPLLPHPCSRASST